MRSDREIADRAAWFVEARFGMSIHWGLFAIPARGEWARSRERMTDDDYRRYFNEFNPGRYSAKRWAEVAKRAGQRYAVFSAKGHDGFCLFESDHTDFHALKTPARRDFMLDCVDAFRAQSMKVGFYYSLMDWHHPDYPVDCFHPLRDVTDRTGVPARYAQYVEDQVVKDLLSRYGRIDVLWFDGSYDNMSEEAWQARALIEEMRGLQPHILINNRLTAGYQHPMAPPGLGDFSTPQEFIPSSCVVDADGKPCLWEACVPLGNHFGYMRDGCQFKTATQVVRLLVECVSKGGNLLLNVAPNAMGELAQEEIEVLLAVGRWLERNGVSVYGCDQAGLPKPDWGWLTRKENRIFAHVIDHHAGPIAIAGLAGKVLRARMLGDGSEVTLHSAGANLYLNIGRASDPIDTVVVLEL